MHPQLFRYAQGPYGGHEVLLGASFDLLIWFVLAAMAVIIFHAVYKSG